MSASRHRGVWMRGAAALALALAVEAARSAEAAFCRALNAKPEASARVDSAAPSVPCPSPEAPQVSRNATGESQWLLLAPAEWTASWDGGTWKSAVLRLDAEETPDAADLPSLEAALCGEPWTAETATWEGRPAPSDAGAALAAAPVRALTDAGEVWRYRFDLSPWLSDEAARAAFAQNGLAVRIAGEEPGEVVLRGSSVLFRAAVEAQPVRSTMFAVGYIDSAPRDEPRTPDHVLWEQGGSVVGKVVLNGSDPSECRAIVSFPEELAAWPPGGVGRLVAKFDAEIQDWSGVENLILYPLRPGPRLERRRWEDVDLSREEPPCPSHGPSWAHADGPVPGASGEVTPWAVPMALFTDGVMGEGPWFAGWGVTGEVVRVKNTYGTATFDLTGLWQIPGAREALLGNGAIVLLDPVHWPRVLEKRRNTRVNLYRPDIFVQTTRLKYSWMDIEPAGALPLEFGAPSPADGGAQAFAVVGLDPAAPPVLQSAGTLGDEAGWTDGALVEDSPVLLAPGTGGARFYRLAVPSL